MFKNDMIINLILFFGLPLVGGILAILIPSSRLINPYSFFFAAGAFLLILGWSLLAYSKWPQIKSGELIKFGPPKKPHTNKISYVISYCMIFFGFILIFSAR